MPGVVGPEEHDAAAVAGHGTAQEQRGEHARVGHVAVESARPLPERRFARSGKVSVQRPQVPVEDPVGDRARTTASSEPDHLCAEHVAVVVELDEGDGKGLAPEDLQGGGGARRRAGAPDCSGADEVRQDLLDRS